MSAELDDAVQQFGPYLVYERLGVGGMATVHRALERGIDGSERMVALKRLLPHLAEDASFIKSFIREAKLASLLSHVNIVQIFELGRVGTEYFISMEYIDGKDIRRILRHARKVTGPPPLHVTVGLLIQLCEALDYAHTKTDEHSQPLLLVHRDVSPSNVIVTTAGHVKVIDFGIAKAQSSALRTQTGRVKGKLAYMAPEAVSGKDLDARSDLFALGVITHELLTARPLFASKNEYQTLLKVQRGDIMPPSTFNQTCPPELDAIVLKALARDPADRFLAASEMRDELLALRRRYKLQTDSLDIATWVNVAFSLDADRQLEIQTNRTNHKTPPPQPRREDDEAVEIAWGGGDEVSAAGPVLLDEVPDVSNKHLSAIIEDFADDMPTPVSRHGRPSSRDQPPVSHRDTGERRGTRDQTTDSDDQSSLDPRASMAAADTQPSMPMTARVDEPIVRFRATTPPPMGQPVNSYSAPPFGGAAQSNTLDLANSHSAPPFGGAARSNTLDLANSHSAPPFGGAARSNTLDLANSHSAPPFGGAARSNTLDLANSHSAPPFGGAARSNTLDLANSHSAPPFGGAARSNTLDLAKSVQTKPGYAPVPANTAPRTADVVSLTRDNQPKHPLMPRGPNKTWILIAALFAAGAIATAVTLFLTRENAVVTKPEPPSTPTTRPVGPKTTGMVKFDLEPPDAEVWIEGKLVHSGSPWMTELGAGAYQVQIQRTGYTAWLTMVELSATETQVLRVVLQPLASETTVAEAALKVSSNPPGLDVVIDGIQIPQKTPINMPLTVGPHSISLRKDGVELWKQDLVARASADYEFAPSMDAQKQRERELRRRDVSEQAAAKTEPAAAIPPPTEETADSDPPPSSALPETTTPPIASPETAATASATTTPPPPAPEPTAAPPNIPAAMTSVPKAATATPPASPVAVAPPKAETAAPPANPVAVAPPKAETAAPTPVLQNAVPTPVAPTQTITVPPSAVTKIFGATPEISQHKHADIPASVAAKVCINHTGRVTSVAVITKLDNRVASDITRALERWRYAPYKRNGAPSAACFVVSFKLR